MKKKRQLKFPAWRKTYGYSISLCMIMRNEEKLLSRCLESVKGLVSQIIIVDTGSVDRSVEIARAYGALVHTDPWQDDFARPRNIGIKLASARWILILDPDEVLSLQDHNKIREHTLRSEIMAYRLATRNYNNHPLQQKCVPNPQDYFPARNYYGFIPSLKTRLFQNNHDIYFRGCWHELLDYDIHERGYRVATSQVPVHHFPEEINQGSHEEKTAFYLKMGEKKVLQQPEDPQAWWELAVAEHIAGFHVRALRSCLKSMKNKRYHQDRLYFLAAVARQTGHKQIADVAFQKAVCITFPSLTHIDPGMKGGVL